MSFNDVRVTISVAQLSAADESSGSNPKRQRLRNKVRLN